VAVVASLLTVLPLWVIMTNLAGTMKGRYGGMRHSPSLRFVVVAVFCFLAATLAAALMGFRSVNETVHFTLVMVAGGHLLMYGFVSFTLFGAIYYIVPRLLGTEWASPALIRSHFWYAVVGLGLIVASSALGGLVQGLGLEDPKIPMIAVLSFIKPFLAANLLATLLMLVGHVCLTASFSLIVVRIGYAATQRRPAVAKAAAAPANAGSELPVAV
jgi:cytochrome c oxidase cbb3-type subunit 1